jgi:hypothetical protein
MTVGELRELLHEYEEDMEVRLLMQPSWPFEYSIGEVFARDAIEPSEPDEPGQKKENCVFLTEGSQLCYGPRFE